MAGGAANKVITVKYFMDHLGANYQDTNYLGYLQYYAQKNYIEKHPKKGINDDIFFNTDSFTITAIGITAWINYCNEKEHHSIF